jgi:hypothetical protein
MILLGIEVCPESTPALLIPTSSLHLVSKSIILQPSIHSRMIIDDYLPSEVCKKRNKNLKLNISLLYYKLKRWRNPIKQHSDLLSPLREIGNLDRKGERHQ